MRSLSKVRDAWISSSRLNRCLSRVRRELDGLGVWTDGLAATEVFLVPIGFVAHAWYDAHAGIICVPAVSLARASEHCRGLRTSLADVLRHEFGHGLAAGHSGLFRSKEFRRAFGSSHDSVRGQEYDQAQHVTPYAASAPAEDFAECFALFVKHSGQIPRALRTPDIQRRWTFVRRACRAIAAGRRHW